MRLLRRRNGAPLNDPTLSFDRQNSGRNIFPDFVEFTLCVSIAKSNSREAPLSIAFDSPFNQQNLIDERGNNQSESSSVKMNLNKITKELNHCINMPLAFTKKKPGPHKWRQRQNESITQKSDFISCLNVILL